ncbi:helix-turn-helix domain-containing protein [Mammaliicoccus sp. Dog046]|uniref:helix-turn-helix domain-containing protein n=1 Tax=Mammaliicoccus sp. Dog046 TaxID=3034233 RepID=UPI002B25B84E|nr:helix-turn-helix domain-containing protein [Mammaliicoccus sp. Dog046]WQK84303.1 helix-turn-helix domain-containing protein [Mammaliicoccus sp. Dog046]
MQEIVLKALSMKHEQKTDKSIYNILVGKKTHQTYFDATIEHLKLYYGCLPNLKYDDFENIVEQSSNNQVQPIIGNYFYSQAVETVGTLLLLIQMVSQKKHEQTTYQPLFNNKSIQHEAKKIYIAIKDHREDDFINEVYQLFKDSNDEFNHVYLHYLLAGYRETPYTLEQIALLEDISLHSLGCHLLEEYQFVQVSISDEMKYPVLSQIKHLPLLHQQTVTTYQLLQKTQDIAQLADIKRVKTHTIHDHIVEMYIKGYLTNKNLFISNEKYNQFIKVFEQMPNQSLKYYYENTNDIDYFELKLMYAIYAMEGLNVT